MLPADGRWRASWAIEIATSTAAISVSSTDSGNAAPANIALAASEVATAPPGAIKVTD